jgi:DNA-3-methyladenine glycosylase II
MYLTEGALDARAPFDFAQTLRFVAAFTPMADEQRMEGGALRKAVMIERTPVVFTVRSMGDAERPHLQVTLASHAPLSPEMASAALDRIRFFLSLDDDLTPFYATAQANDPAFLPVIQRLYGMHQVKFLTPFENACWAVLTQRTPMPVARSLKRALIERHGASLWVDDVEYWAFPAVETLATASRDEVATLLRNERKANYLHAVAEAFAAVDEAWLRSGDYEQVREWLLAIDGIGAWSATFVLIRGLGRMESVATPEKELLSAARSVYGPDASPDALSALARHVYGESAGYWAYYLRNADR